MLNYVRLEANRLLVDARILFLIAPETLLSLWMEYESKISVQNLVLVHPVMQSNSIF